MVHESIYKPGGCKACHTKTKGVIDEKCLHCHTQIMEKIRANAGLHARVAPGCAGCHSEHHGRHHNLIKLDIETFDHNTTGWTLSDTHAILKCSACHSKGSYLLYKTGCVDCHEDIHKGENGTECLDCHNPNTFMME